MQALETARFRLRPIHVDNPDDRALYCRLYTSPEVMARIMPPLTAEQAVRAFERTCRFNGQDVPGHRHWSIWTRDSGSGVGVVGLLRNGPAAELGGLLVPGWWRRGASRETYARVIAFAFEQMGVDLVFGERKDDAHALVVDRLFEPLGLRRVAPGHARTAGVCRWELPRSDWSAPLPVR
jgi:RimJ/RimL family protein N-acetyltransferase